MKQLLLSFLLLCGFASMAGKIVVTNGSDHGSGSLREAISMAVDGDVISFKNVKMVVLTSGQLTISKSLTIEGRGVTIKGSFAPLIKIGTSKRVSLNNVVFWESRLKQEGAILNLSKSLTVDNCKIITTNSASQGRQNITEANQAELLFKAGNVSEQFFRVAVIKGDSGEGEPSSAIPDDDPGGGGGGGGGGGDTPPPDGDGDGVPDASDNCPTVANANQLNTDGDAQGNACDPDDDNDGVPDASDNCPLTANPNQANTDGDAQGNACDLDDDNDGVPDISDNCPLVANANQLNTDGDAQGNVCDADIDGDGVLNAADNCPLVANANQLDSDSDGTGDACDNDTDGDGVPNTSDNCPSVANANQLDTDGDGTGNACDQDTDGDGIGNATDNCPSLANTDQANTDGDAFGNVCDTDDDNDGIADPIDNCPLIANANQLDTDGDGIGDACDTNPDTDGDGVNNSTDNCPLVANANQMDTDGDGQGNVCDTDDDNDGVLDVVDNCSLIVNPDQLDTDNSGHGNVCDLDDDGDGVLDVNDCAPLDPTKHTMYPFYVDGDGDGYGTGTTATNLCAVNATSPPSGYAVANGDCNDGVAAIKPGATEVCDGIDNNCNGTTDEGFINTDGDSQANCVDADDDNDGTPDVSDCAPLDPTRHTMYPFYVDGDGDGYGTGTTATNLCAVNASTPPSGYAVANGDCNDGVAAIKPGATEVCDGIDNNCNGTTDEGFTNTDNDSQANCVDADDDNDGTPDVSDCAPLDATRHTMYPFYVDGDGDGYGTGTTATNLCAVNATSPPSGYAVANGDCNDGVAAIKPGATEVCDGIDNNCNGTTDEGFINTDGDSQANCVDADDDNDGTPDVSDCAPLDPTRHTMYPFYIDGDGDGYGTGTTATNLCAVNASTPPSGYAVANGDCNDGVAAIKPGAMELCDGIDNNCNGTTDEGFTNTDNDSQANCVDADDDNDGTPDVSDCAPLDATRHTMYPFYVDGDGDGYGTGTTATNLCAVNASTPPSGYAVANGDCNDGVAAIKPGATEVCDGIDNNCNGTTDEGFINTDGDSQANCVDADDDNDGTPDVSDCAPLDPTRHTMYPFYIDGDGDGYGTGTTATNLCAVNASTPPSGYAVANGDCNDGVAAIKPGATEVCDGIDNNCNGTTDEGFINTDGDSQANCVDADDDNDGTPDVSDCAPLDATRHTMYPFYVDGDGDGYGTGTTATNLCAVNATSPPAGYAVANGDCNDGVAAIKPGATEVCDGIDNNCNGTTDEGFINTDGDSQANCVDADDDNDGTPDVSDCAPLDATRHTMYPFYVDSDGDGYGTGITPTNLCAVCASTPPLGYSANNTDCNDNNAGLTTRRLYYVDNDRDGFGSNATAMLCSLTAPVGYAVSNGDCNDNNATINPQTIWVLDVDVDGYHSGAAVTSCTSPGSAYVIKSIQLPGDCKDNNASVNPGAVEVCSNQIDDNCNGVVDEVACYPCKNATNLTTSNITSTSAKLNWVSTANPVQWQLQHKTTKQGSKWVDVLLTGNKRSTVVTGLQSNQNYLWQIRAKCGNSWTSYPAAVAFTTLANGSAARTEIPQVEPSNATTGLVGPVLRRGQNKAVNALELQLDSENSNLKLSPNPTTGPVYLDLQFAQRKAVAAVISIFDLRGIRVHTERATLVNGLLHKQIQLPVKMTAGTYLVEIIVNNTSYTSKLVLTR